MKNINTLSNLLINDSSLPSLPILPVVDDSDIFYLELADNLVPGVVDCISKDDSLDIVLQKINSIVGNPYENNKTTDLTFPTEKVKVDNIKVYLIEDDPLLQDLMVANLQRSGFLFEINGDCEDVIVKMKSFSPQVIILDLMLPNCSGFDILKLIKKDEILKNIPIVIFSNRDSSEDRKQAEVMGVDRFFIKAMTDLSELMVVLKDLTATKAKLAENIKQ